MRILKLEIIIDNTFAVWFLSPSVHSQSALLCDKTGNSSCYWSGYCWNYRHVWTRGGVAHVVDSLGNTVSALCDVTEGGHHKGRRTLVTERSCEKTEGKMKQAGTEVKNPPQIFYWLVMKIHNTGSDSARRQGDNWVCWYLSRQEVLSRSGLDRWVRTEPVWQQSFLGY